MERKREDAPLACVRARERWLADIEDLRFAVATREVAEDQYMPRQIGRRSSHQEARRVERAELEVTVEILEPSYLQ